MSLVNVVGAGMWLPSLTQGITNTNLMSSNDTMLLDADEEEAQFIGSVHIDGGGSKTFGTSGSKIDWLPGASITFAAGSTLTVGVKKSSTIDAANGPAARATIGAAAFDVYTALIGGTDTITSTTWRSDSMASGTPYTVADGDLIALCWHLDTTSGTPNVKVRCASVSTVNVFPANTLVTSGPTYTAVGGLANAILTFDDGTLGWIEPSYLYTVIDTASATIGNTNIYGNIFRVPFACTVDAIAAVANPTANTRDLSLDLYSTPLGTPSLIEGVAQDANIVSAANNRLIMRKLTTPRTLAINTDYCVGVRQTTAGAVTTAQRDVSAAAHFKPSGMGAECYAAISTAGATFAAQNSGNRRYLVWVRISALDSGGGGGGLLRPPGMAGGING